MLVVVTDRKLCKDLDLIFVMEAALRGGAHRIILREKDWCVSSYQRVAAAISRKYSSRLIVHSRPSIAKAVGAHGLHLTMPILKGLAKRTVFEKENNFPKNMEISVSVHTNEEANFAQNWGADWVLAGHVFRTQSKRGQKPKGVLFIEKMAKEITLPIVAIGGITPQNQAEVYEAGASGVAVLSPVMASKDPEKAVRLYL